MNPLLDVSFAAIAPELVLIGAALVLWLGATRRWRDAAISAFLAATTLLLLLPFISIAEQVRALVQGRI